MINLDLDNIIHPLDLEAYKEKVQAVHAMIESKSGAGNDYLGWLDWPKTYDKAEFELIKKSAKYIRENFDILVVAGIGGSYLGARAAIEALQGLYFDNKLEIIFLGQTLSSTYTKQVLDHLKGKKFAINVISKSGTTTETSIAFRLLKDLLESQVGKEEARKAIFATTDAKSGALRKLATQEGYVTFTLPGDIGGRYSVLTAVGLLPIAAAGLDIDALMAGALKAYEDTNNDDLLHNNCYKYAVARDFLYRQHYGVEMFVTYEPQFAMISEWLKQLYGESEGKEKKGLLPSSVTFSTDLHSLGQFIQEGSSVLFETIIYINNPTLDLDIPFDAQDLDGLNYLVGKKLSAVNEQAFRATLDAHVIEGKVPNLVISLEKLDEFNLGYLFYFFMRSVAMSGYLLEINPFNQPGVEVYKRNMFKRLGKPGF
jgi:glucose-6-phosphate isomerase